MDKREIAVARSREWRKANRSRHRQYSLAHQKQHPEMMRMRGARRRAKERGVLAADANHQIILQIAKLAQRIQDCIGVRMSVDHIIPVSLGGLHHHANVQAVPFIFNCRKANRTGREWTALWASN